jgi:transposase-like protein
MSVESDKKKRKVITLDTKLDIIKRFDNGQSKASISRALGLNESTVRLIVSKSDEYKEQGKVASTSFSIRCTRNRNSVLVEMENLLITWPEDCNQTRIPIGTIGTDKKEEIASEGEGCVS